MRWRSEREASDELRRTSPDRRLPRGISDRRRLGAGRGGARPPAASPLARGARACRRGSGRGKCARGAPSLGGRLPSRRPRADAGRLARGRARLLACRRGTRGRQPAVSEARRIFLARSSRHGRARRRHVALAGEAFAALGDREMADRAFAVALALAARSRDTATPERIVARVRRNATGSRRASLAGTRSVRRRERPVRPPAAVRAERRADAGEPPGDSHRRASPTRSSWRSRRSARWRSPARGLPRIGSLGGEPRRPARAGSPSRPEAWLASPAPGEGNFRPVRSGSPFESWTRGRAGATARRRTAVAGAGGTVPSGRPAAAPSARAERTAGLRLPEPSSVRPAWGAAARGASARPAHVAPGPCPGRSGGIGPRPNLGKISCAATAAVASAMFTPIAPVGLIRVGRVTDQEEPVARPFAGEQDDGRQREERG